MSVAAPSIVGQIHPGFGLTCIYAYQVCLGWLAGWLDVPDMLGNGPAILPGVRPRSLGSPRPILKSSVLSTPGTRTPLTAFM